MSTGLECAFVEDKDGWTYRLMNSDCPRNVWDWTEDEYSTLYGPFSDFDTAEKHLSDNHANPGGHSVSALE